MAVIARAGGSKMHFPGAPSEVLTVPFLADSVKSMKFPSKVPFFLRPMSYKGFDHSNGFPGIIGSPPSHSDLSRGFLWDIGALN